MQRWQTEWRRIGDRIAGLQTTASQILAMLLLPERHGIKHKDMWDRLKPTLIDVRDTLETFHASYRDALPPRAAIHLRQALDQIAQVGGSFSSWENVALVTPLLAGLRAEVSASLVDPETEGRQRTERAFEHLSRSIVVDDGLRERWEAAYVTKGRAVLSSATRTRPRPANEIACERLGAVHLLLHGIWAFKSDAPGERTDLVLQEKLAITRKVEAAEALVLTEWKVAKTSSDVEKKAKEGKHQVALYGGGGGSLAATELATVRYIVLVTERREVPPDDVEDGQCTYRFINVAVSPENPSREARRRSTGGPDGSRDRTNRR